jgi:hypothetical protein
MVYGVKIVEIWALKDKIITQIAPKILITAPDASTAQSPN